MTSASDGGTTCSTCPGRGVGVEETPEGARIGLDCSISHRSTTQIPEGPRRPGWVTLKLTVSYVSSSIVGAHVRISGVPPRRAGSGGSSGRAHNG